MTIFPVRFFPGLWVASALFLGGCATDGNLDPLLAGTGSAAAAEPNPVLTQTPAAQARQAKNRDENYETMLRVARRTWSSQDRKMAATLFQRLHLQYPDRLDPLLDLAALLTEMAQPREAELAYRAALSLEPDNRPARLGLAKILLRQEQPGEALDSYLMLLAQNAKDRRALNGAGVAEDLLGNGAAAQAYFKEALALAPNDIKTLNNLAYSLIRGGQPQAAVAYLEQATRLPGVTARTWGNLALAYGMLGQEREAARILRRTMDDEKVDETLASYRRSPAPRQLPD